MLNCNMLSRILFVSILIFCSHACGKKNLEQKQEILAIKEMSDLATVEYVVTKIIRASDDKTWYKFGDRKILMSCKASLKAGIDFSKISESDISISGKEISLQLPHARLLSLNIRPEDLKVEYQDIGLLRTEFSSQERDQLAAQAQKQIEGSAEALGILQTSENNAALFITNLLRQMGYEKVNVSFGTQSNQPHLN